MDQRIINLFDEYTHKPLSREIFLKRLSRLAGGTAAAAAILPLLEVNYASAMTIREDDPELVAKDITYPGGDIEMKGYLVEPKTPGKKGAVVVIHENRGLNPHIRDVARRVAKAGYIALAPDGLSGFGGTPANEDEARGLIGKLEKDKNLIHFTRSVDYLASLSNSNGKVGCVGFCWGGAMANQLAVNAANLKAAVAFYGRQPESADVAKIKAAVQLHYGGLDEGVNKGIPDYEAALKAAGVKYELFVYDGAQHAFHNDTAPTRYNEAAAKTAWERTLRFFKENLS